MRISKIGRHKVEIAAVSAVVILVLGGILANRTIVASRDSADMVGHTYKALSSLNDVRSSATDMIAASRGFALTGSRSFLNASRKAAGEAVDALHEVGELTRDNPTQQAIIPALKREVAAIINDANQMASVRTDGDASRIRSVDTAAERDLAALDALLERMESHELKLLSQRSEQTQRSFSLSQSMLAGGIVVGLGIVVLAAVGAVRDNWKRRVAEEELFIAKERAQVTLSSIGDAVISTDEDGTITFINHAAAQLTGWPSSDAVGRPFSDVFKIIDARTREPVAPRLHMAMKNGRTVHLPDNSLLVSRNGTQTPIEDTATPIFGSGGKIVGAVKVFRDVSAARELAERLHHKAKHDHLTGLPNRILLNERINHVLASAKRKKIKAAVLFLDLDGFKKINDRFGHAVGDKLLKTVSRRLSQCLRECDTVSRLGGDEFVALLEEIATSADALATGRRILDSLAIETCVDGHRLSVTCSIGIAMYPEDGKDAEDLLARADAAMYAAKSSGRSACCLFGAIGEGEAQERAIA